jgi:hypothetical protein
MSGALVLQPQKPRKRLVITKGCIVGARGRRRSLGCVDVRLQHAGLRMADRQQNNLHVSTTPTGSQVFPAWLIETRQHQTHDTIYVSESHVSAHVYDMKVRG